MDAEQREAGRWISEDRKEGRKTNESGVSLSKLERLLKSQTFRMDGIYVGSPAKGRIVLQAIFGDWIVHRYRSPRSFCQFRKDNH